MSSELVERMRAELENTDLRLEEERQRSAELLLQVTDTFGRTTRRVHLLRRGSRFCR